jgi:hypothetical protein
MRTTQWTRRLAVTGCAAGLGLVVVGAGTAAAQGDPTTAPAPITISSAQVEQLCQQRVPRIKAEVAKLVDRIDGGPDVVGSTRWLQARQQQAGGNGRTAIADALAKRINRRSGVLGALRSAQTKLTDFTSAHCGYLAGDK